ncbi:gliding motility-associated peptidyl-prolyl isomerase GldI [Mangrovimonas sp. AS39]|uniref:gliding motility-associated peptidyl-prolyl isomerase GldI n=1 Tax=Mangrovimonas TaxID=1211036 RepID=UPI00141F09A4|nr:MULTISPECIES: gliding motility-associated peptidyl-prolyl isomerase GldI [Mangrovimonas]MCF1192133.1 gliding motility-associated peptidyl-prolyl isomerase GldI [Mangrovimonas futianensis]MCF1195827.1 gliding motility-associated peptidyl-prolyl isomerase GldI [Mangrovimonas futianensis]MCF1422211.1 gliding motility-associated peptidyl-prolyl isomerase GldI [Mangrovimonas futianensis]NIK92712.1 gliding motility-associated peptidyl-prolyl isomerase GldI [Mangrovimonas sp. CR14]
MRSLITCFIFGLLLLGCKSPEARRPVSAKSGSFIDKSVARNIELNARETAVFEKMMQDNPEINYFSSQNGFWYFYNTKIEDSLIKPNFGDLVKFDYNIKTINGDLIYSKKDLKTQNYIMDKQELFSGLREGLKLMKSGETVTFLFPSQKAYGYYGDENRIGMNVPLVCEVTIHSIIDNNTP